MIEKTDDKVVLARKRAELVEKLNAPQSPETRVRIQGELSIINAKIKAINTTSAAQLKAAADRRKISGLQEAQANAARAHATVYGSAPTADDAEDDDPGQTAAIDGWIDAVLLRHDVEFTRDAKGRLGVTTNDSKRGTAMEQRLAATVEVLVEAIYAAARGQELPDLPSLPRAAATPAPASPKAKAKKR